MSSTSQYLSVSGAHIDSLINYVVDVKPYHVKLSEIVEQYLFEENLNVSMLDKKELTAFLGADILPAALTAPGVRRRRSNSWVKSIISDGNRKIWPVPVTAVNKFASQSGLHKFTFNDSQSIDGFPSTGVFSLKRWDGVGINDVRKNGVHQQESKDYFLSHGAFTFDTRPNQGWKERSVSSLGAYAVNPGAPLYKDTPSQFGLIKNIENGNYEEWTLTVNNLSPLTFVVRGSTSGNIGTAQVNVPFTSSKINFLVELDIGSGYSAELGDKVTLTPSNKIVVAADAPEETWSIIKVNPIGIKSKPAFTSSHARTDNPGLKIHTRSIDRVEQEMLFTVVFGTNGDYTVNRYSVTGSYSVVANLKDGCSFRNDDIHFTLITTEVGFYPGDSFSFQIEADTENFLVYGSVSGWQANAQLDKWYFNGKVGFKIPSLDYFVDAFNSTIVTSEDASFNSWNTTVSNNQILKNISFDNGLFLTAGDGQIVGASTNGTVWTSDISSVFTPIPGKIMLITGENGLIAISNDGGHVWHTHNISTTNSIKASTVIPNFLTDPDNPSNKLSCIIVVGELGSIFTSTTGYGWAEHPTPTTQNLNDIAWSNDAIIVVGNNGTVLRSLDRLTWDTVSVPTTNNLLSVIYESTSNSFIAVGQNGTILRSTNGGLSWFNLNAFSTGTFSSICYGEGKFVCVGPDGWIAQSTNGITWTRYLGKKLNAIAYGNGVFVGVGGKDEEVELFTALKTVHSMAEPSTYTITFINSTNAVVFNNIYGYRRGLVVDQEWSDEFCSFKLSSIPGVVEYRAGDVITVNLAPKNKVNGINGYDVNLYDLADYDANAIVKENALLFNAEYFPLYHGHGAVIFKNIINTDTFIIDAATKDNFILTINGASSKYPELFAQNDDIPLEFRYYDRVINDVPTSIAEFSDLATYIEAYLASNPSVKVFSIVQPRFEKTNRNANAVLTFDTNFFNSYLPFNTKYSMTFLPDDTFGQTVRVKFSESLRVFARIRLNFDDIIQVSIDESNIDYVDITGHLSFIETLNVSFTEGGALPILGGYDNFSFDSIQYDSDIVNGVVTGMVEVSPGVYDYTGNPDDWTIPKPTSSPSMQVKQSENEHVANTSFTEGLMIAERLTSSPGVIDKLSVYYDNNLYTSNPMRIDTAANKYLITHNGQMSTPTVTVANLATPLAMQMVIPNLNTYSAIPSAVSNKSFVITLPSGITAPFLLKIV